MYAALTPRFRSLPAIGNDLGVGGTAPGPADLAEVELAFEKNDVDRYAIAINATIAMSAYTKTAKSTIDLEREKSKYRMPRSASNKPS